MNKGFLLFVFLVGVYCLFPKLIFAVESSFPPALSSGAPTISPPEREIVETPPISEVTSTPIVDEEEPLPTTSPLPEATATDDGENSTGLEEADLVGDINKSRTVDVLDYTLLSNNFGSNKQEADLNSDGVVNIQDFVILSNNFGRSS